MSNLTSEPCTACKPETPRLDGAQCNELLKQLPDWRIENRDGVAQLERAYAFSSFMHALAFTNAVGRIAEDEDHHPALLTEWGKVTVTWWSHSIKGLHRNDFIMAARTDQLAQVAEGRK